MGLRDGFLNWWWTLQRKHLLLFSQYFAFLRLSLCCLWAETLWRVPERALDPASSREPWSWSCCTQAWEFESDAQCLGRGILPMIILILLFFLGFYSESIFKIFPYFKIYFSFLVFIIEPSIFTLPFLLWCFSTSRPLLDCERTALTTTVSGSHRSCFVGFFL